MNLDTSLPEFLMTSEEGSFAQETILHRKPRIIEKVISENNYPSAVIERLTDFKREIASGKVQPLTEDAPDVKEWNGVWASFKGRTWLELPWYFAEAYFYRRLLEAVGYFGRSLLKGLDPFSPQKREQLIESLVPLSLVYDAIDRIDDPEAQFENLLHASLWGNRVDLSNLTVSDEVKRRQGMIETENLLINDFSVVFNFFKDHPLSKIAFVNDNVGIELGFDLILANFLLGKKWAEKIVFYLKPYPFFVSDAMIKDLLETIEAFEKASTPNLRVLGWQLKNAMSTGDLSYSADWFWASPYHFCEMSRSLRDEISHLNLVILKGDVNYRRLLSDRHWPHTTPISEIVGYFPTSLLILRTLKGEIMVNLKKGQAEKIGSRDPDWLISGKYGIIQHIESKSS